MAAPLIDVTVERFDLDGERSLIDLRLQLDAGNWTCLLGPSGIGKTCLIRLITGLWPGASVVASDGQPVHGRIALMAQQDLLLPWLTALENVVLGQRLRGERADYARARALLHDVGLGDVTNAMPRTLSGGMRQRVAIARTLLEDRDIVLMDEPFSALDAITRHQLQDLSFDMLKDRTVLLVTHNPLEALRLGHRILIMRGHQPSLHRFEMPPAPPLRDIDDTELLRLQPRLMNELLVSEAAA